MSEPAAAGEDEASPSSSSEFDYGSITPSVLDFEMEEGRRYHGYRAGKYMFPNDEQEQDRLDFQHAVFKELFHNRLSFAPIESITLDHVLDIATGTGIWAIEFAEAHPDANVIGSDLSPIQPTYVPPNLSFEIADAEDSPWVFPHPFNYIHARAVASCFSDPKAVMEECFRSMAPGGLLEFQDPVMPFQYCDPQPSPDSPFLRWTELSMQAARESGRRWDHVPSYRRMMAEVGFEQITERRFPLHTGPYGAARKRDRRIGHWQLQNWLDALEGLTIRNLARIGWKPNECQVLVAQVRQELIEGRVKPWTDILVVWGRKPVGVEVTRAE